MSIKYDGEDYQKHDWKNYAFYTCVHILYLQANSISPEPTRPMPTHVPTRLCRNDHYKTIIPIQYAKTRRKKGFYLADYYYAVPA